MLRDHLPYGPEPADFNGIFEDRDEQGVHYAQLMPVADARCVQSSVVAPVPASPLAHTNPYPKPGSLPDPGPFTGAYPRVERLPK